MIRALATLLSCAFLLAPSLSHAAAPKHWAEGYGKNESSFMLTLNGNSTVTCSADCRLDTLYLDVFQHFYLLVTVTAMDPTRDFRLLHQVDVAEVATFVTVGRAKNSSNADVGLITTTGTYLFYVGDDAQYMSPEIYGVFEIPAAKWSAFFVDVVSGSGDVTMTLELLPIGGSYRHGNWW